MRTALVSPAFQAAVVTIVVAVATAFGTELDAADVAPLVATVIGAALFVFSRVRPVPKSERGLTAQSGPSELGF